MPVAEHNQAPPTSRPAPRANGMTGLCFTPEEAGTHLADWTRLADRAIEPNPFFRPEFLLPYLARMAPGRGRICVVRRPGDGAFLALAPFCRRRPGLFLPATAALVEEYGPLGTPLVAPEADAATLKTLFATARKTFGSGPMTLPYQRTDGPVFDLLQDVAANGGGHLEIDDEQVRAGHATGPTGQEQYDLVGTSRRREIERQLRRLKDLGAVQLTSVDALQEVMPAFEDFLQLEASGWKGKNGTALASRPDSLAFARDLITAQAKAGRVRIDRLTLDGTAIAAMVMLRDGHRIWSWKVAYDERYARYSPGAQLTRYSMRQDLAEPGLAEADSLAVPHHPMITPLWRGTVPYATVLLARGPLAATRCRLLRLDLAMTRSLRHLAKAGLRRLRAGRGKSGATTAT